MLTAAALAVLSPAVAGTVLVEEPVASCACVVAEGLREHGPEEPCPVAHPPGQPRAREIPRVMTQPFDALVEVLVVLPQRQSRSLVVPGVVAAGGACCTSMEDNLGLCVEGVAAAAAAETDENRTVAPQCQYFVSHKDAYTVELDEWGMGAWSVDLFAWESVRYLEVPVVRKVQQPSQCLSC